MSTKTKKATFGTRLIRSMKQAVAFAQGDETAGRIVRVPGAIDVKALRKQLGLSQAQFADRFGFNRRTIQDWEQGRAQPDISSRSYLTVIQRKPKVVEQALRISA